MTDTPTPRYGVRDASNRAVRTLIQGLIVDLSVAVALALSAAIAGGIQWTRAYWIALALAVAKSAVTAIVAYTMRYVVPPGRTANQLGDGEGE